MDLVGVEVKREETIRVHKREYVNSLSSRAIDEFRARWAERGIHLDAMQEEACQKLERDHDVLVCAPTGSGKTLVAFFAIDLAFSRGKRTIYTAPVKALSNQKYLQLCELYGADNVGVLTGDVSINADASIVVMTTEVLRNMLLHARSLPDMGCVILDEVHYLADRSRGQVWEEVILALPAHVRLLSLSATIENRGEFVRWLSTVRGQTELVYSTHRPVPLTYRFLSRSLYPLLTKNGKPTREAVRAHEALFGNPFHEAENHKGKRAKPSFRYGKNYTPSARDRRKVILKLAEQKMLPALEFIFSRKGCSIALEQALSSDLCLTDNAQRAYIEKEVEKVGEGLTQAEKQVVGFHQYGHALMRGFGMHHAGMLPSMKALTERLMSEGLLGIVYATGTLALGIDMPVRSVVLESVRRFDGDGFVEIRSSEAIQLLGRAGRRGKDKEGFGVILDTPYNFPSKLARILGGGSEDLISAFAPSYNTVMNLLCESTYHETLDVLSRSFAQFQRNSDVVELEEKIRELDIKISRLEKKLDCECQDAREYAESQAKSGRTAKVLRRQAREKIRKEIDESLQHISHNTVYAGVYAGKLHYFSVLDHSKKSMNVITSRGQKFSFMFSMIDSPLREVGKVEYPHGLKLKNPEVRKEIGERIYDVCAQRIGEKRDKDLILLVHDPRKMNQLDPNNYRAHRCKRAKQHIRHGKQLHESIVMRSKLVNRRTTFTNTMRREVDAIIRVLEDYHLVKREGSEVIATSGGHILRNLHMDLPLVAYQALQGLHSDITPEEFAAWTSIFICEDRAGENLPENIHLARYGMQVLNLEERIREKEREHHLAIDTSIHVTPGMMDAFYAWAQGAHLNEVLEIGGIEPGDFIMMGRRVIDILSQFSHASQGTWIEKCALAARDLIKRGEMLVGDEFLKEQQ